MSDTARKMFPVETVLALAVAKKGADVKDIAGYITGRSIVCDACAAAVAPFAAAWLAKLSPKFLDMNYKDGDNWGDFVNQGARLLGDTISLTPMDDCLKNAVATVLDMMDDYLDDLKKYVDDLKVKRCKGVPYKTIKGTHIFVDHIPAKVFYPLNSARNRVKVDVCDINSLYHYLKKFNDARVHMKWETKMSKSFVDAYKAAGAFYTMKNLIMFHGCKFREKGKFTSMARSLQILTKHSKDYNDWRLLGIMKDFIEDNGISIEGKIAEWRK